MRQLVGPCRKGVRRRRIPCIKTIPRQHSEKWVRAMAGATAVVDSKAPLLFWEQKFPVLHMLLTQRTSEWVSWYRHANR